MTQPAKTRGAWVLLSHGLATDLAMWDELTDALKDRYRVLRYDARGHGKSMLTPGPYTIERLASDALRPNKRSRI